MPQWSDFGNIWSTLREVDVSVIRAEAEQPIAITCIGHAAALDAADQLLHTGDDRYGLIGINPIESIPFTQAVARMGAVRSANLVLVALDAREPVSEAEADTLAQIEYAGPPIVTVVLFGTALAPGAAMPRTLAAAAITIPDPAALDAAGKLGEVVYNRLPVDLRLAAARRLPANSSTVRASPMLPIRLAQLYQSKFRS